MRFFSLLVFFPASLFLFHCARAQTDTYILNGSAKQNSCNCYTLTENTNGQSGSVWNAAKIDLSRPFDFSFNVYLGCLDEDGADGIAFILQPLSTSLGVAGEGMGFEGVTPSVGISIDTWQNTNRNDPVYDHIGIQINGDPTHGNDLAPPVPASAVSDNIEDCQWHQLRISWDAATKWMRTYFDGVLRNEVQYDFVANVFNNDPMVYWGFSGATGGAVNLQAFCTALDPDFNTNLTSNIGCFGQPVVFSDQSRSFAPVAAYSWDFGDGTSSTDANPPPHQYPSAGIYDVKLAITARDGCISFPFSKKIVIGDKPLAGFEVYDTCSGNIPRIIDQSSVSVGNISQWSWLLNGNYISNAQQPILQGLSPNSYQLQSTVTSVYGCMSDAAEKSFVIKPSPVITAQIENGCLDKPISFFATQQDNATTISQWSWQFGDSQTSSLQNPSHTYTKTGAYKVSVSAEAANGCSMEVSKPIFINFARAIAGNDTLVLKNSSFQLHGIGGAAYSWSPALGLSNASIANPLCTLENDITYRLTVTTAEGCTATDDISITVFKSASVFVPTAFSPNKNGLNENFKPLCIGIKRLIYFTVYNRWGQKIFSTGELGKGWDGTFNGKDLPTDSFVWILKAEDIAGTIVEKKGTITIIR